MFKKNQKVTARTVRGTLHIEGKVVEVHETLKGKWVEVQPDDKNLKAFKTRECCVDAK